MSTSNSRIEQMFPTLTSSQMATARRFASAEAHKFEAGETVYDFGEKANPVWIVLEGSLEVYRHDGPSSEVAIVVHKPGQFTGEVSQLSGRPSLVRGVAGPEGCVALPFDGPHLRAMVIGSADIGELVMRAYILRRVALIDAVGAGSILIGVPGSSALTRLQGFLTRSGYPHLVLDCTVDEEGKALVKRLGVAPEHVPVMVCPNGTVLKRPTELEAAICLGITPDIDPQALYDVAIVGAGPAGLAAAVYAASEGLKVIVVDERAAGGQAGASARIENYLGFPTGISGQALAGRAFNQALKFGADIALPLSVLEFQPAERLGLPHVLKLTGGRAVRAKTVVIASGARYRRPRVANIDTFEGAGVSYWATPVEARLCQGEEIALVGGGNSAGQAVAYLAPQVRRLNLVVRRPLEETMSRYLVDRIAALSNVVLHVGCEIASVFGNESTGLSGAILHNAAAGQNLELALRHLFLFIGADPNAEWVRCRVARDGSGFILTGADISSDAFGQQAHPLETSVPNLFAIGDVRSGSTKRVAAAVGEGAAVVAQIHAVLKSMDKFAEPSNQGMSA